MGLNPLKLIGAALNPIGAVLDLIGIKGSDRDKVDIVLGQAQNEISLERLELERTLIEGQTAAVVAEAKADSVLTRTWRPIIMLSFAAVVVWSVLMGVDIPPTLMVPINIGLGGYIGGRTVEKVAPAITQILKKLV